MASGPAPINEPGGWFLARAPGSPKPAREGWERMTYWSMYGGTAFLVVALCGANPSADNSVQEEAEALLHVHADKKWVRGAVGEQPTLVEG